SASGKGATDQDQKPKQRQRQDQQLREQARSHSWTGYIRERLVGCQIVIAGKPASTGMMCICKRLVGCQAAFAEPP
ncbi:hypothetical protein, partial [Pseudomonas sp. GM79]|uniref:hypothetical protein n=1 Tax=Pseudomonas sp. GM79 TaxID=1144338 RepID=UPI001EE69228